jgi:LPXTG-motif cell wall-anchored protein
MKRFVPKVFLVMLALVFITSTLLVSAATVLQVMTLDEMRPYRWGQDMHTAVPAAGVINNAVTIVVEYSDGAFTGLTSDDIWGWIELTEDGDWTDALEMTATPGRLTFDVTGISGHAFVIGTWVIDDPYDNIVSVTFYGPAGGTVNPQTSDSASSTMLIVSGVGLVASLLALAFVFKKKNK